jgi:dinuclear metal center YbgI/SA1388 family protein
VLVADVYNLLNGQFPFSNAPTWDPVGLQLGDMEADAGRVAVAHEVTDSVVESVLSDGIVTVVAYHPLLFEPIVAVVAGRTPSGRALRLLRAGVSLLVVHTAMDVAPRGTADALLESLGVETAGSFAETDKGSGQFIGRFGSLGEPTSAGVFTALVSKELSATVQFAGDPDATISSVAAVPGSGSSFIAEAGAIADVYITGDVDHHRARSGLEQGVVVLDAGHIPTERPGVTRLYDSVRKVVSDAVFIADDPHPWEDVSWKT